MTRLIALILTISLATPPSCTFERNERETGRLLAPPAADVRARHLTSLRHDADGNATVVVGIFMNRYPSVVGGDFFPFELYDEDVAQLAEGEFKGFAADVITGKHPFEGFKSSAALEKARARSPQDPYHFDGYYLKIMVVGDDIAPLPTEVYLHRGFFPPHFSCPAGQESVEIKADDNGTPSLGTPNWTARAARTVTFCKAREIHGPYAGRYFYYTRVSLSAPNANYIDELYDDPLSADSLFADLDSQYHETISALASFVSSADYRDAFSAAATVVNLNYDVVPKVLELQELLQQNSTVDLSTIVESTDKVQRYLYDNRNRDHHDADWQVLLLAQRKWLAIRTILEHMGKQPKHKAEQLRAAILTSLEMADVRDMLPMTKNLTNYRSAADYIAALHHNPAGTVDDQVEKDIFFSTTSQKHFNHLLYHIAIASTARQWVSSRKLYSWIDSTDDIRVACVDHCSSIDGSQVLEMTAKAQREHADLRPFTRDAVYKAWMTYVNALNKVYPDAQEGADADFKKKYVAILGNTIDYENSSSAYQAAYQSYARRYNLVFAEPHGLLMATKAFMQQMGEKRKPEDVHISKINGQLQYDWKMHSYAQYHTIDPAIREMWKGIYRQAEELHKLAQKIHRHTPEAEQQVKLTAEFAAYYQIVPLAKALLIRPDYAFRMNAVFKKHTRFRADHFLRTQGLPGIVIALTIAAVVLSIPTLGAALPAFLPGLLYGVATAAGLLASAAHFQHSRVVQQRAESSLFADNFGANFEEYYRARREYHAARRALYAELALTAFDAGAFVKFAYRWGKSARQIKAITKILGNEKVVTKYHKVYKRLKYCSSPYCRKFVHSVPILTAKGANVDDLTEVLEYLAKHTGDIKTFKKALKNLWMNNNVKGAFDKVIKMEFIDDVIRTRFLPLTDIRIPISDIRIPFVLPRSRGIPEVKRVAMSQLLDKKMVEKMNNGQVADLFSTLVYGRKYRKRFFFFTRNAKSQRRLLGKKLGLQWKDKDLLAQLLGKDKKTRKEKLAEIMNPPPGKKIDRKAVKKWLEEQRTEHAKGTINLSDASDFIAEYKNSERLSVLRVHFTRMLGKIAEFKKKAVKVTSDTGEEIAVEGAFVPRSPSRLLRIFRLRKDAVEQVADNRKWRKIFSAGNEHLRDNLLGKGGDLASMLNELNKLSIKVYESFQPRSIPI